MRKGSSPCSKSLCRIAKASLTLPARPRRRSSRCFPHDCCPPGPIDVGRLDAWAVADVDRQLEQLLIEQPDLGAGEVDKQRGGLGRQLLAMVRGRPLAAPLRDLEAGRRLADDGRRSVDHLGQPGRALPCLDVEDEDAGRGQMLDLLLQLAAKLRHERIAGLDVDQPGADRRTARYRARRRPRRRSPCRRRRPRPLARRRRPPGALGMCAAPCALEKSLVPMQHIERADLARFRQEWSIPSGYYRRPLCFVENPASGGREPPVASRQQGAQANRGLRPTGGSRPPLALGRLQRPGSTVTMRTFGVDRSTLMRLGVSASPTLPAQVDGLDLDIELVRHIRRQQPGVLAVVLQLRPRERRPWTTRLLGVGEGDRRGFDVLVARRPGRR